MSAADPEYSSTIYENYAAMYDRTGQMRFSILMELYLRDVLQRHSPLGRRMLDLACGTGTLALMMAESGWNVVGIDAAPAMLKQARVKQTLSGVDLAFFEGDMRSFTLPFTVHLVTCCYDSLNYLLDDTDLLRCFESVYNALEPGGLFCFDLATEFFLATYWQGSESFEDDGYSQIMESSYDPVTRHSRLVLRGTTRNGEGSASSFSEVHVERAVDSERVRHGLALAGFVVEALYDCFTFQAPTEHSLRHFWVARRPMSDVDDKARPDV